MELIIFAVIFLVLAFATIGMGVRLVPQGYKHVVQRLGKYHKTLGPGLNLIIPYVDTVAYKVTTKDIVLEIPSQEVITRDNAVIIANAVAYINIVSPEKSVKMSVAPRAGFTDMVTVVFAWIITVVPRQRVTGLTDPIVDRVAVLVIIGKRME